MIYALPEIPLYWKPHKKTHYLNYPMAFDIETSSFEIDGEKRSCMYVWSFAIGQEVFFGRTWEEFKQLLGDIKQYYDISLANRIIIYVHNLSYEFAFMGNLFDWKNVFCIRERRPIYACTVDGFEFRCSYLLTGLSLENVAKSLNNDTLLKRLGYLDYSKIRHSKTPLTSEEMEYCAVDVKIITAYISKCMEEEGGDITKIPLTKTSYARRMCRNYALYGSDDGKRDFRQHRKYTKLMQNLTLTVDEYKQLKRAFAGGFTHCSCLKSNKTHKNVTSFDFASSYPAVMVAEKFPMSRGELVEVRDMEHFESLFKNHCVLFNARFTGICAKVWYEHYISVSKCYCEKNVISDNGRLVSADTITITLTDVDWNIIKYFYEWEQVEVSEVRIYRKFYLPTSFVKPILILYQNKTELKDIEGQEDFYMRCKTILNSCFGMTVTDIVKGVIDFLYGQWVVNEPDFEKSIEKYNKSRNRFLFYPWGVWVCYSLCKA